MEPVILLSAPADVVGTALCCGLVAYLCKVHSYARERGVRIDTVADRRFVIMDPPEKDEALAYAFVHGASEAFAAGWEACSQQ